MGFRNPQEKLEKCLWFCTWNSCLHTCSAVAVALTRKWNTRAWNESGKLSKGLRQFVKYNFVFSLKLITYAHVPSELISSHWKVVGKNQQQHALCDLFHKSDSSNHFDVKKRHFSRQLHCCYSRAFYEHCFFP